MDLTSLRVWLRKAVTTITVAGLLTVVSPALAQMQVGLNKDSLKRMLNKMPGDTLKVKTLITLGQQYESNRPDSAIYYYKLSYQLSQQLNYPAGIVRYISNYTAVLNVQGKFDESLKLNLRAVEICRKAGLKKLLVVSLMNTGAVYQYKEDYASAANYYLQALPLLEAAGSTQSLSLAYGNLCGLYRNLKQSQKALTYARLSLKYAENDHDLYATANACINIGNALKDNGQIELAINYLKKAHFIGVKINDVNSQETALIDMADAYVQLNRPDRYIGYFRQALPLAKAIEDVSGQAYALNGICLGLFWQKQYHEAEKLINSGIAFAQQHDQKEVWNKMLLLMSDVQIAMGKPENSRVYRSRYDSVSNLLTNTSLLKNIQELETKYGLEKKQREILQKNLLLEQKERETQRQRQWLLGAAAGMLILVMLVLFGYRYYRQKQLLNAKALQVLKAEQESQRLKGVIEGEQQERKRISQEMHDDMGAGLTRMLFLSRTLDERHRSAEKIGETAQELIRKMNEVIWTMNDEQDTLDSLIAYIRTTVADILENAQMDYSFVVDEPSGTLGLNGEYRRNIYLAVKEAVHNVVKHAAASKVELTISAENSNLKIRIQDNGRGINSTGKEKFGNGLKNMHLRIRRCGGKMDISGEDGTLVRFEAPLPI
jgi:two-component system NarL family sensor kinase